MAADSEPEVVRRPAPEAAALRREPLLPQTTDLICQVQPGEPSLAQTLDALELIATQVAPALGWRPAREPVSATTAR